MDNGESSGESVVRASKLGIDVHKMARPELRQPVQEFQEKFKDERARILRGGLMNLLDLPSEDRLMRVGWVLHIGKALWHEGPSTLPQ